MSDADILEKIKLDYERKNYKLKEKLNAQKLEDENEKNIKILGNLYKTWIIDKDGRPL